VCVCVCVSVHEVWDFPGHTPSTNTRAHNEITDNRWNNSKNGKLTPKTQSELVGAFQFDPCRCEEDPHRDLIHQRSLITPYQYYRYTCICSILYILFQYFNCSSCILQAFLFPFFFVQSTSGPSVPDGYSWETLLSHSSLVMVNTNDVASVNDTQKGFQFTSSSSPLYSSLTWILISVLL